MGNTSATLRWCTLSLGCLLGATSLAQHRLPIVGSYQKISATQGSFSGRLINEDHFGRALTTLGDLDGDGVTDLAVGQAHDDDGGTNRGAVWILFMNANGTVKSQQKISDTQGGFTGTLSNNGYFGVSLSCIGDLDLDGTPDLAVGHHSDDDGGTNRGAAWILFLNSNGTVKGHQKISTTQGNFTGSLSNSDYFGGSVGNAGDVDGDGVSDLAVGARADDDGGTNRGAIWILYLNRNGSVRNHAKISDTEGNFQAALGNSDYFGASVSGLGDLDKDGVPDLATGAMFDDDGGSNRGAVYVLLLNSNGTVKSHQKISNRITGKINVLEDEDRFGFDVANAGDLNLDGTNDLIVGAYYGDEQHQGAAFLVGLNPDGSAKDCIKMANGIAWKNTGLNQNDYFGVSVTGLGDFNGDGLMDWAVGASQDDDGGSNKGAVYILFSNEGPRQRHLAGSVLDAHRIAHNEGGFGTLSSNDQFGQSAIGIGDINGDGIADMAIGAPGDDDGGEDRGAAYVLFLNANHTVSATQKISLSSGNFTGSLGENTNFGYTITPLGDLDKDGVPDIALGCNGDDDGNTNAGAVWILFLNSDGTVKSHQKISNTSGGFAASLDADDRFGRSVACLGDVNRDGIIDLAVGARDDDDGGTDAGAAYILFLNTDGTVKSHQKISNSDGNLNYSIGRNYHFGESMCSLGDLNGDGTPDLALGGLTNANSGMFAMLMLNEDGTVQSEMVHINTPGTPEIASQDYWGKGLACIGDLNGDGYPDVVTGALGDDDGESGAGAFYVLFLNPDGSIQAYEKLSRTRGGLHTLQRINDNFAASAGFIGDLDGDGFPEMAIGAPSDDQALANGGAVYILTLNTVGRAYLNNNTALKASNGAHLQVVGSLINQTTGSIKNDGEIYLSDQLRNDGSPLALAGNSTGIYRWNSNRSTNLNFDGSLVLNRLAVNKSMGQLNIVSGTLQIEQELAMNAGVLQAGPGALVLGKSAIATGGNAQSFVAGYLDRIGNAPILAPLGGRQSWHPITIDRPESAAADESTVYRTAYFPFEQTLGSNQTESLESLSECEHWTIEAMANPTAPISVGFGWDDESCATETFDPMVLAVFDTIWGDSIGDTILVDTQQYRSGILKSGSSLLLNGKWGFTFGRGKKRVDYYATLSKKPDGGYYQVNNGKLKFYYDNQYQETPLIWKVYNQYDDLVASSQLGPLTLSIPHNVNTLQGNVVHGRNLLSLDFTCSTNGQGLNSGYYVLEIENQKGEKEYLRFQQVLNYVCGQSGSGSLLQNAP